MKVEFILIEKVFLGGGVTMTKAGKCKLRTTTEEDSIGKKIIRLKKATPLLSRSSGKNPRRTAELISGDPFLLRKESANSHVQIVRRGNLPYFLNNTNRSKIIRRNRAD